MARAAAAVSVVLSLLSVGVEANVPQYNLTKCPSSKEVRLDKVARKFDLKKFMGKYYELAFHDYTQYPTCPKPSCPTSTKSMDPAAPKVMIDDAWTLKCYGEEFVEPLRFNLTDEPGVLNGWLPKVPQWWKILEPGLFYPDAIVDFEEDAHEQYKWVIEFQCTEKFGKVWFTGINFYSRVWDVPPSYVDEMEARARAAGLGVFLDTNLGITRMNHSECNYTENPTTILV
jgi:hypothetical protein